jgi:hypothetical protein
MKTIAEQLNIKEFPFEIRDKYGNQIYWEDSTRFWEKREFDLSSGKRTYYKDSDGIVIDDRPKYCDGKMIELEGKLYQLKEIK